MSKIRSLSKFCIGLSAAALLTLGLAGPAQSEYRPPLFDSLSSLQATFQGLADAIREHHEAQRRQVEESEKRAWMARYREELPSTWGLSADMREWMANVAWEEKMQREQRCSYC